jgi:WD40 repeat protein
MIILKSAASHPLNLLAISFNGLVAAGSHPRGTRVELWEATTGKPRLSAVLSDRSPYSLAFTPDGRFLLICSLDRMIVFDVTTGTTRSSAEPRLSNSEAVLSPQGNILLVVERYLGQVSGWRVGVDVTFTRLWSHGWVGYHPWIPRPAVSFDGQRSAVLRYLGSAPPDPPNVTLQIRETARGETLRELPLGWGNMMCLAFTSDGTRLLEGTSGRVIRIRDVETGNLVGTLRHPGKTLITAMAVQPGGRILATCRADGKVWLWDLERLREIRSLDWRLGKLVSLACSPDGALAAAGSDDGRVVVWDFDA